MINLVFKDLPGATVQALRARSLGVALTTASVLFLLGPLAFAAAMLLSREIPPAPLVLYAVGAVPVALRAFVPEVMLDLGLVGLAVGIAWLAILLLDHSRHIAVANLDRHPRPCTRTSPCSSMTSTSRARTANRSSLPVPPSLPIDSDHRSVPIQLGERRVLHPGRWRWLRAVAWLVLLFFLTAGAFGIPLQAAVDPLPARKRGPGLRRATRRLRVRPRLLCPRRPAG